MSLKATAIPRLRPRSLRQVTHPTRHLCGPFKVPQQHDLTLPHARSYQTRSAPLKASSSTSPVTSEAPSFPCLDAIDTRTENLKHRAKARQYPSSVSGPEPSYTTGLHQTFQSDKPLLLDWGGVLPSFNIAYETWGTLNASKSNAILLHTGLSASSHAASTPSNGKVGWWERFIGPGRPLDTNKYFVVCTNVLGGCYGSTGPSSYLPGALGARYATRFPILTLQDMVRAQFRLLDDLKIQKLYASVGSSLGGMQSLAAGVLDHERVARIVSISGCARSHPYTIAMRHTQRQVLMNDPAWASTRGNYYSSIPPHAGMKLARQIATITYRSGPEWEQRFGRRRADPSKPPALCPDFLIETYLDHAGEKWCLEYDANSLLYVSKAMDLFDLGAKHMAMLETLRVANAHKLDRVNSPAPPAQNTAANDPAHACDLTLPDKPYEETEASGSTELPSSTLEPVSISPRSSGPPEDLVRGLSALKNTPTLVMGAASDILFPAWQQREVAETLRMTGNTNVKYVELGEDRSLFGHDTFLMDLEGIGGEIQRFLG